MEESCFIQPEESQTLKRWRTYKPTGDFTCRVGCCKANKGELELLERGAISNKVSL
jgi:hypothetical protein